MRTTIQPSENDRLLTRCRRGDERAWSQLVEQYERLVYSIPRRMGLSADDCQDVFQNTFIALMKGLDRIENAGALTKWLSVTAAREALRLGRIRSRTRVMDLPETLSLQDLVADEERSAEQMALDATSHHLLRLGILALQDRCRRLLTMLFLRDEEPQYQQISEEMGIPMGAIGPTRSRCLEKLRKHLREVGFFSDH